MTRWDRADHVADRAARDSLRQQIAFLGHGGAPKVHRGCAHDDLRVRRGVGGAHPPDGRGQRGKGIPFDDIPHVMVRMCAAGCILAMSGKLEEMEVE